MTNQLMIYLTTSGRPERQKTWNNLPEAWRQRTMVVVQARESSVYWEAMKDAAFYILPPRIVRLSDTRQYLLDHVKERYVCLLDDDLVFFRRKRRGDWHLTQDPQDEVVDALFTDLEHRLREGGWAHVGVSPREGNNRVPEEAVESTRMMRVLGYDLRALRKVGARFDRLPVMSDFDMTLQLLRAGLPNHVSYRFAQGQYGGSNSPGGCSVYRTPAMLAKAAKSLARLHPGFVRTVEKSARNWGAFEGARTDVTVFWKKAFLASRST